MLINWQEGYSIHNKKIDEQHKKLFELAKKASLISNKFASREEIREILSEFFEYMKVHFGDEEAYMESIGYPLLADHKDLHKHIVKELSSTILQIKNVNDMKEKLGIIAQEWLLDHILHHDMLIERYRARSILDEQAAAAKEQPIPEPKETLIKQKEGYYYSCDCKDKIHTVSKKIHSDIQEKSMSYKCKQCGKPIAYTGNFYFEKP